MRVILLAVLITLAGCSQPPAPEPTGQIDGAALNHLLVPYSNATIHLLELDRVARSTELGGFSFYEVPPGYYTLVLDLGDIGADREVVAVKAHEISKVIMQVFPHEEEGPHSTLLSDSQVVRMAMPGEDCEPCAWKTAFRHAIPERVDVHIEWDGHNPLMADLQTHLIVHLEGPDGILRSLDRHVVQDIDGRFIMDTTLHAALLEDVTSLRLRFEFDAANEAPHPDLKVESSLRLHYAD